MPYWGDENKMETKQVTTDVKPESLARDIARILRFIGVSADVISLRIAGTLTFASGVLALMYFNQIAILAFASIYVVSAVVILLKASQIERCYDLEFNGG